ncbi:MAG TPA: long-chain fatty acid--CoA ligase [Pseudonocardiaceae bacterium]|nr:long-chain fatty acid--CoA ligase [Pseudonocardiaceae bacterium]
MSTNVTSQATSELALIEGRPPNVAQMFLDRVAATPDRESFRFLHDGEWTSVTWAGTAEVVKRMAAGLVALGVESEQRVAIAAPTSYNWILADLAIMCAGAATTTVYPTTTAEDVAFIVGDSDSRVVFAEDDDQVAKLREHRDRLPSIGKVVVFHGTADGDWVIGRPDLERLGEQLLAENPEAVQERIDRISPDSLATLIYTSGTTGKPKGVRLRHSSWTYEGAAVAAAGILGVDDLQYLWLPLAHSFGKVLLTTQLQIGFPTAVEGRVETIIENLAVVRPTFMGAAPRIFEKAYSRIITMTENEGGAKLKIFNWAFDVGLRVSRLRREGKRPGRLLAAQHKIADRLVFSKIRERFGGRIRFFISGAAALNRDIAEWFHAAGILILEGYGLTETSAGSFVNRPDEYRFGTVGRVFTGTEVRIAEEDGEILIKGPGVMDGYHNQQELTTEVLGDDGWFHTGDIGELDPDGLLRITDRKKDLFKTSGGKYIAPTSIESQFKAVCPYVSEIIVHGESRNYCTAIITLDPDALNQWAAQNDQAGKSYGELVSCEPVRKLIEEYVATLNGRLNRWETIKNFVILESELSVEGGELTPSMKVRRKTVEDKYRDRLDALYG